MYTRRRIHHALNGKSKSSSTLDILRKDLGTYRKWIEWQCTLEMNWSSIENDLMKPICLFDVSKGDELEEAFSWRNTQPLIKEIHKKRGLNKNFLD